MIVTPFRPFHIDLLRAQGVQAMQLGELEHAPEQFTAELGHMGPALTVFDDERHVVLCGGIIERAHQRGECWAALAERAGRHMMWLHYATKRFIEMKHWRRLEATVPVGFGPGCRWVQLLDFKYEGRMKGYGLNGETHLRYARVLK